MTRNFFYTLTSLNEHFYSRVLPKMSDMCAHNIFVQTRELP